MTASRPNRRQTAADKLRAEIALAETTARTASEFVTKYPTDPYNERRLKIVADWTAKANEMRARLAQMAA